MANINLKELSGSLSSLMSESQEDFTPIGIPDQETDDELAFGLQEDLLNLQKDIPRPKSGKSDRLEDDLENHVLTDDLEVVSEDEDDISDIDDFFKHTPLIDSEMDSGAKAVTPKRPVSKKDEQSEEQVRPRKVTKKATKSESDDYDSEDDEEVFTSGINLGSGSGRSKSKTKVQKESSDSGAKKAVKKTKVQEATSYADEDYDEYEEDDDYEDGDDGKSVTRKLIEAGAILFIIVAVLFIIGKFTGIIGKEDTHGQMVTQEEAQQATQQQQEAQANQQPVQNPWNNDVGAGVLNLEKGTVITNPMINYDVTVYQDQISINKFLEIKEGSITPKFVGIAKHLGKEIEFTVSMEDYNKYVNGVELTVTYVSIIVDQKQYVSDIKILQ